MINEQYQPLGRRRASTWQRWVPAGLLAAGLLGTLTGAANAATYYVSPSGNDSSDGSSGSPWKSVAKAARTARAGDTVLFRTGVYYESLSPANAGSGENSRITFKAAPGESPVLDGGAGRLTGWTSEGNGIYRRSFSGTVLGVWQDTFEAAGKHCSLWDMGRFNQYDSNPNLDLHGYYAGHDNYNGTGRPKHDEWSQFKHSGGVLRVRTRDGRSPDNVDLQVATQQTGINIVGKPYITIDGLRVRRFKNLVYIENSPNTRLVNGDFRYAGWTAMWLVTSNNCEILNCVWQGAGSWMGHYEDSIHQYKSVGVRYEGNDISYGGHSGLFVRGGSDFTIRKNRFHTCGGSHLTIKLEANKGLIEDNVFSTAPYLSEVRVHKVPHAGVQLSGSNHVFRRNLFYRCGYGMLISCSETQTTNNNQFINNTFATMEVDALQLQAYSSGNAGRLNNNVFKNNIVVGAQELVLRLDLPGGENSNFWGNQFINNCWNGTRLGCWTARESVAGAQSRWPAVFQGNIEADPQFVNPGGDDYHLRSGSPAIDRGVSAGMAFAGSAPDLGALEFNGNGGPVAGPSTPPGPAPAPINQRPTAAATATPTAGTAPLSVRFSGGGTDADGRIVRYAWSFGDGGTSPDQNPSHTYTGAGNFTATLTVTDDAGATASASVPIRVETTNRPPQAMAQATPRLGPAPLQVRFTGSGTDPDGTIASYQWSFGDGRSSTAQNPTNTYTSPGDYTAQLTVTDNRGATGTATVTIKVEGATTGPSVTATADPTSGEAPLTVRLQGSATDSDGSIARYEWRFGDGGTSPNPSVSHVFTNPGTYVATLTAWDTAGNSAAKSVTITARERAGSAVTLKPAADTYVRDGDYAGQNFGADAILIAKSSVTGYNRHVYLAFDLSGVKRKIKSAKLRLLSSYTASDLELRAVRDDGWQESRLTWNSKPAADSQPMARFNTTQNQPVDVDVTAYMLTEQGTSNGRACLALLATQARVDGPVFSSKEADANACPQLLLTLAEDTIDTQPGPEPGGVPGPVPGPTTPGAPPAPNTTQRLNPIADAYTRDGWYAGVNFGTTDGLWTSRGRYTSNRHSYLKFDLSRLPGGTIASAKLRLYVRRNLYEGSRVVVMPAADDTWQEEMIFWNSQPAADPSRVLGQVDVSQMGVWVEVDVTSYLRAERAGNNIATFVLQSASMNATEWGSRESDTQKPELVISIQG